MRYHPYTGKLEPGKYVFIVDQIETFGYYDTFPKNINGQIIKPQYYYQLPNFYPTKTYNINNKVYEIEYWKSLYIDELCDKLSTMRLYERLLIFYLEWASRSNIWQGEISADSDYNWITIESDNMYEDRSEYFSIHVSNYDGENILSVLAELYQNDDRIIYLDETIDFSKEPINYIEVIEKLIFYINYYQRVV